MTEPAAARQAVPRLFGTDGIRAPFGRPPLDRPTVVAVAAALGHALRRDGGGRPRVVIGGDTRDSTPEICRWLAAGLAAAGAEPRPAGVVPTPAVAWLVREAGADAGVAVSASHNPWPDNGIKLIDRDGFKWSEAAERALEARVAEEAAAGRAGGAADGGPERGADGEGPAAAGGWEGLAVDPGAAGRYLERLAATVGPGRPLAGIAVALDPGNGAASALAGPLFERLGATVHTMCAAPDGRNVNRGCGSTAPGELAARVAAGGFDLGLAFDGDADRAVAVDERGAVRDGDAVLYLWATALAAAGELAPRAIVVTSMSNLGLERALARHDVAVVRCGVGDREVVETMRREGIVLGGEQSGHVVHLGLTTTGDGLLTAVQLAAIVHRAGRPLSALLEPFERFPQVLVNVPVAERRPFDQLPRVAAAARRVDEALGAEGRLVLRYSGTEPLARIMIEGPDQRRIEELAEGLAAAIRAAVGAGLEEEGGR